MSLHSKQSQKGAALLTSLVFLLVLTIIGISSLNNSGMEARMSHNFQLGNIVFHAAETTIDTILFSGDRGTIANPNLHYHQDFDAIDRALNIGPTTITLGSADIDPDGFLGTAAVTTSATVQWVRYNELCPGGGSCNEYAITSDADIAATSATATHMQGITVSAPALN